MKALVLEKQLEFINNNDVDFLGTQSWNNTKNNEHELIESCFSLGTNEDFIFFLSRRITSDLNKLLWGESDFNRYTLEISFDDSIASIILLIP